MDRLPTFSSCVNGRVNCYTCLLQIWYQSVYASDLSWMQRNSETGTLWHRYAVIKITIIKTIQTICPLRSDFRWYVVEFSLIHYNIHLPHSPFDSIPSWVNNVEKICAEMCRCFRQTWGGTHLFLYEESTTNNLYDKFSEINEINIKQWPV
jgi:hypothetical protein